MNSKADFINDIDSNVDTLINRHFRNQSDNYFEGEEFFLPPKSGLNVNIVQSFTKKIKGVDFLNSKTSLLLKLRNICSLFQI